MKIFIPFKISDIGGTSTFAKKFKLGLEKQGHEIFFEFKEDYDILFLIGQSPLRYLLHAKINKRKIVQRLDGVFSKASGWGKFYWIYNLKMKIVHNYLADFIIYQSNFSKLSCEKLLGKRNCNFEIIYNGVEVPKIKTGILSKKETKIITVAKFRRKDQIFPLVEAVKELSSNYKLDIYGSFSGKAMGFLKEFEKLENINYKDKIPHSDLLKILPQYDIFIFSDQSACPNSVLEALGAGLPVAAYNRGSIDELIETGYNGEITHLSNHDPFTDNYPFKKEDYKKLAKNIEKISQSLVCYKNNAQKSASEKFDLDIMINKYVSSINKIIRTKND